MTRLSAIVVVFGKESLLEECLASLDRALACVDGGTELVLVLNDASPALRGRLAERPGDLRLIEGDPSLGFAGGAGVGIAAARGEWIALVNDDCLVRPDALAELLAAGAGSGDVGAVAAQIQFADRPGTINSAGLEVDELGVARERLLGSSAEAAGSEPVEVFGAGAALGLFRREMLDSVAGIDASFFAYLEDADLAWRARMAGWRTLLAPRAVALHQHSATLGHGSSCKYWLVGRNRVRMLAKNATGRQLRRRLGRIVLYDLLYVGWAVASGRTAAPLTGRLRGLAEWRRYRAVGAAGRRELALPAAPGLRAALGRNRVYGRRASTAQHRRWGRRAIVS